MRRSRSLFLGALAFFAVLESTAAAQVVGVNYFATGTVHATSGFIGPYHLPGVRATVQQQLAAMAAGGTTVIRTPLWFVDDYNSGDYSANPEYSWRLHFPATAQELDNIRAYVEDVASANIALEFAIGIGLGCSNYSSAPTGCTYSGSVDEHFTAMRLTYDWFFYTLALRAPMPTRSNGAPVVTKVYFNIESGLYRYREDQVILTLWPHFVRWAQGIGVTPHMYFLNAAQAVTGLQFLRSHGLFEPESLDFSLYAATFDPDNRVVRPESYAEAVEAALDMIPDELGVQRIGVAETLYPLNTAERAELGAALASDPRIVQIMFWPLATDPAYSALPPFDLAAYRGLTYPATRRPMPDFNLDGRTDLLWRHESSIVALWFMNGFSASGEVIGNPGPDWTIEGTGDFDGDGRSDILLRNAQGLVHIWFMNGSVPHGENVAYAGLEWTVQGAGDFNGDGKSDILWRNTAGQVHMWLMNRSAPTSVSSAAAGVEWTIQGTGDFNGDGKSDILWRNTQGTVHTWLMDGSAPMLNSDVSPAGGEWTIQGTGDFNGDGKSDVLWRNTEGLVHIWFMNGTSATGENVSYAGLDWTIQRAGDFNSDGKSDILWRNISDEVYVWFMNRSSVLGAGSIGTPGNDWQIQLK